MHEGEPKSIELAAERVIYVGNILFDTPGFAPICDKKSLRRYIELYVLQLWVRFFNLLSRIIYVKYSDSYSYYEKLPHRFDILLELLFIFLIVVYHAMYNFFV